MSHHVLSLLVEDKPGLLTRVAGLFSRRGFNINSLAVGPTEVEGLSRITVVVDVEDLPLEQVTKQLNKLINVIKIVELDPAQSVQREHLLIKVRSDIVSRSQILEAVTLFRARVVDVATDALVIEVTGDTAKVQAFLRVLEPYGIRGAQHLETGLLGLGDRLGAGLEADLDLDARVAQVERVGVALRAVADHGDLLALDEREVGVLVVEDLGHCFSFLIVWFRYAA